MFRLPEVARDRHQALEERWGKGLWLGHARHTPEAIIATEAGIVKAYAVKRLPADQQWDDEKIKRIKGSPNNWKLDAGIEPQLVEIEDRRNPELDPSHESRAGTRVGEKRSMYLSRKDFNRHGYTDGCTGCRDLASGKQRAGSFISPPQCRMQKTNGERHQGRGPI